MQDKLSNLIKILLNSESTVASRDLANELQVSDRTIRNYIQEINGLNDKNIISANSSGYYISDRLAVTETLRVNLKIGTHIPQNNEERFTYIVQKLLRTNFLNTFDLANELYISYSTLKRSLNYINKRLSRWHVKIRAAHDQLFLSGKESNKRKLFSYLIYRENTGNLLNSNYLEKFFGKKNTSKLQSMVDKVIKRYELLLNEFSYNNLLLHLLILISRLSMGKTITHSVTTDNTEIGPYTIDLAKEIKKNFSINITSPEIREIDILFKTNTNLYSEIQSKIFSNKPLIENIHIIIDKVKNMYLVDLSSIKFVQHFSIYLYNLLYSLKHNFAHYNPIKTNISNNFPLIYDIATYVAFLIDKLWDVNVSEDEIGFIALPIGAEIERQKHNSEKLKAELVVPTYLNIKEEIHDFFRRNFTKDITIVKETDKIDNKNDLDSYDLIFFIMLPNIKSNISPKCVFLSPFDLNKQKLKIQTAIDKATLNRKKEMFKSKALSFFSKDLFWNINKKIEKEELTKKMYHKMKLLGIVNKTFYDEIMQRESMGPTAFSNVAIIHPMNYNSSQTKVAVALSKRGIKWDNKIVNMVFMISISKQYKDDFRNIYENLIDFLSNKKTFEKVLNAQNIDEFYKNLLL